MRFAFSNGIALHYVREGAEQGIPLLFINSLGTDLRIWDGVAAELAGYYPLVRYDKRGHGLSDAPSPPYSIRDHTRDLAGLLDILGIRMVHMIGISVGGMIALDFAATRPDRVQSLVLLDTGAIIGTAELWNERIHSLRKHGMAHVAPAILSRWFVPTFERESPAAFRGYANMLIRTPIDGYVGTCEAIRDADLRAAAGEIHAPALLLCGREDTATPPSLVRGLADLMPKASYQDIPNAAHLPCAEQPGATAALIRQFL